MKKNSASPISCLGGLLASKGVQETLDRGRKLFGHPLMLTDYTHKLLAATDESGLDDPDWHNIISSGGIPLAAALDPLTVESLKSSMKSRSALMDAAKDGSPAMLRKTLTVTGKIVGYLNSPRYAEPFTEDEISIFEIIGDLCALHMGVNLGYGDSPDNLVEFFIHDLLAGRITDAYLIRERMDYFGWNIKGSMRILSARGAEADSPNGVQRVLERVERHFPEMTVFPHGSCVKAVLAADVGASGEGAGMDGLAAMLREEGLHAGLSRAFANVKDFAEHNAQADKALELGLAFNPELPIYLYDNYAIYHLLESCQPHAKVMQFCHSAIIRLAEYDRMHSGELVDTLKYYLFHNRNASEAANYVHIHRNTMNYRMNKIRELLNVDIDDTRVCFELMLSFYILDYYGATVMRGSREMLE